MSRSDNREAALFLKSTEIFSELSLQEISQLLPGMETVNVIQDDLLFREGDPGGVMYILAEGRMIITIQGKDGEDIEIGSFQKGNFFGEMSLFQDAPRSATCYAQEDCKLLTFPGELFSEIINRFPATAIKLMRKMLDVTIFRLESTGEYLTDMVRWGEEARKRAVTDSLTGLFNRRFLDDAIEQQIQKASVRNEYLTMLMMDVDHCRLLNEKYGQEGGDRIIMEVTKICRECLRENDIISRYGGDEFTVLLPETGRKSASGLAECILNGVRTLELDFSGAESPRITISIGGAVFPDNGTDSFALREAADKGLYKAKESGRDRIVFL